MLIQDTSIGNDHDFWMTQYLYWMDFCDKLVVLCLWGWKESKGLKQEIRYANSLGIDVKYVPVEHT